MTQRYTLDDAKARELAELARELSQQLGAYLESPVRVQLTDDDLGYSPKTEEGVETTTVAVDPRPFIEGHRLGREIVRSTAFLRAKGVNTKDHPAREKAQLLERHSEEIRLNKKQFRYQPPRKGLTSIYDLLLEERDHRQLQSRRDLAQGLDAALSRYFPVSDEEIHELTRAVRQGRATSKKAKKAARKVPKSLKDMTEWEVLDLARDIYDALQEESEEPPPSEEGSGNGGDNDTSNNNDENQSQEHDQNQNQNDAGGSENSQGLKGDQGEESDDNRSDDSQSESGGEDQGQPQTMDNQVQPLRNDELDWASRQRLIKNLEEEAERNEGNKKGNDAVGGLDMNMSKELGFDTIKTVVDVVSDPHELQKIRSQIAPYVAPLRRYFERVGQAEVDVFSQVIGYELDDDEVERFLLFGEDDIFVDDQVVDLSDYDVQIVIDCSGSMVQPDSKIKKAKAFGQLAADALKGNRRVSNHCWGFTDKVLYDAGTAENCTVSGLSAYGGNNDAAALWHAAKASAESGKKTKVLIMVSDGLPTQCSWSALRNLVSKLERSGFICIQVAIDRISMPAFQHFVDLSGKDFQTAVAQFGNLLKRLVK